MKHVRLPHCIVKGCPRDFIFLHFLNFSLPYLCDPSFSLGVHFSVCSVYPSLRSCNDSPYAKHKWAWKMWCKVRFYTCSQSQIHMEREGTDSKMANGRTWHYSVLCLSSGQWFILTFPLCWPGLFCVFPLDLMEATLRQTNAWGFENAGMTEEFFNGLERSKGSRSSTNFKYIILNMWHESC